jgi:hypothetical protein
MCTTGGRAAGLRLASRAGVAALALSSTILVLAVPGGAASASNRAAWSAAPPAVVRDVTSIPASVYNAVGVTSTGTPVTPPIPVVGQPTLTFASPRGGELPGVFVYCAEYAPFCASERWAVVAALSRFGTFRDLGTTESSSTDLYPNTETLTFLRVTYSSRLIAFRSDEYYGNKASTSQRYAVIQPLDAVERNLVATYDSSRYFPAMLVGGETGFPFIDIGNAYLSLTDFSPVVLVGLTRSAIAGQLANPASPVTQAIVAGANYLTAAICGLTHGRPVGVCSSPGVRAAATALSAGG